LKKLRIRIVHETEKGALLQIVKTRRIVSKSSDLYKIAKALENKAKILKQSLKKKR